MKPKPLSSLNHLTVPVVIPITSDEIEPIVYADYRREITGGVCHESRREALPKNHKKVL
jgi:hypothetical protein